MPKATKIESIPCDSSFAVTVYAWLFSLASATLSGAVRSFSGRNPGGTQPRCMQVNVTKGRGLPRCTPLVCYPNRIIELGSAMLVTRAGRILRSEQVLGLELGFSYSGPLARA